MSGQPREVYIVVGGEGALKIGITENMKARLRQLQLAAKRPLQVLATFRRPDGDAALVERAAHALLRHKRLQGEWFNATEREAADAIEAAIASVEAAHTDDDPRRLEARSLRLPAAVWAEIETCRERVGAVTLADAVRRLLSDALRAEKAMLNRMFGPRGTKRFVGGKVTS